MRFSLEFLHPTFNLKNENVQYICIIYVSSLYVDLKNSLHEDEDIPADIIHSVF